MATRYWVGGGSSAAWNATGNTNWGTASNTRDNASVPGASDDVIFDNAANGNTASLLNADITIKSLVMTGWANTLTIDNISFTVGGTVTLASGMTLDANPGARIIMTETATLTTAGKTVPNIVFNGSGETFTLGDDLTTNGTAEAIYLQAGTFAHNDKTVTLTAVNPRIKGEMTFYNLTRTLAPATTVLTCSLSLEDNITVENNFTANGKDGIVRLLINSYTLGTQRTITAANVTVTNADFRDIKGAGAGSWNLSSVTGGSGDCGGNSGITFTTADDWYWHEGTGNFSDYSKWYTATNGGGTQMASTRVPLPQDTCYFDANSFDSGSQTVTQNMPRIGSIDWTGAANTPTFTTSTDAEVYGSITLISGMTLTNSTQIYTYRGRGNSTLTTAGKTWNKTWSIHCISGKLTLEDNFIGRALSVQSGTFDANNKDLVISSFTSGTSFVRRVDCGSGTWELTDTATVINVLTPANLTFNAQTSTFKLTNNSANTKVTGGGLTFYNLWIATSGAFTTTINGSNTFNDIKINAGRSILFTTGTTQTVKTFTALGEVGNVITLRSTTTSNAILTKSGGGTISCDYIDIDYITGNPDTTWYMGDNSVDGGHNTRIYFTEPPEPSIATGNFFQLF